MKSLLILLLIFLLSGCKETESIKLNNHLYCIPRNFLLDNLFTGSFNSSFDNSAGIVSVIFSNERDLGLSSGQTENIYVTIYSRDTIHGDLSRYQQFKYLGLSKSSVIFDIGNGLRLFDDIDKYREWRVVPKNGTQITETRDNSITTWVADCFLAGESVSKPELSRKGGYIKASCSVSELRQNYLLQISASESVFLDNYKKIISGIGNKIESWKKEDNQLESNCP